MICCISTIDATAGRASISYVKSCSTWTTALIHILRQLAKDPLQKLGLVADCVLCAVDLPLINSQLILAARVRSLRAAAVVKHRRDVLANLVRLVQENDDVGV